MEMVKNIYKAQVANAAKQCYRIGLGLRMKYLIKYTFIFILLSCTNNKHKKITTNKLSDLKYNYLPSFCFKKIDIVLVDSSFSNRYFSLDVCINIKNLNKENDVVIPLICPSSNNFKLVSNDNKDTLNLSYSLNDSGQTKYEIISPDSTKEYCLFYKDIPDSYINENEFIFKMTNLISNSRLVYQNNCIENTDLYNFKSIIIPNQVVNLFSENNIVIKKMVDK